jgi:8-oxo-dGTP pyrophosphatase MutT (NUDIX family)
MYSNKVIDSHITHVKVGVGVTILDDRGRILLEKRSDNGTWGLPGGGIEPGESVYETALREVKEETGLDIEITGLVGVYSEPCTGRIVTYPDNGDVRHLVDIVLMAKMITSEMTISSESLLDSLTSILFLQNLFLRAKSRFGTLLQERDL